MTAFPGYEPPPEEPRPPEDVLAYTLAEHMIGEEYALRQIPEGDRTPEQRDRLRVVERELDRLWHALQRRAEARGRA